MTGIAIETKYDYREEWARFVATLSATRDEKSHELAARIIRAVGGIVDATGGALWLHEAGTSFKLAAKMNFSRDECGSGDAPVLAVRLVIHDEILDLDAGDHIVRQLDLPHWVPTPPRSWLLLPLHHRGWMIGFLVLKGDQPQRLDPEDRDLLRLVAQNAASYLTEHEISRQLREAQAFEAFTRRFAFVMHDLKNMSAQLALTVSNAKLHKDKPEFVADMIDTVGSAVSRMNGLIDRLRHEGSSEMAAIAIDQIVEQVIASRKQADPLANINRTRPFRRLWVAGHEDRLATAIGHILDNALQSRIAGAATVEVTLRSVADDVRLEISDNGDGMDEAFIKNSLFVPFETTKPSGFGIGMTEVREIIEQMSGRIEVESERGAGTTVSVSLPRIYGDKP